MSCRKLLPTLIIAGALAAPGTAHADDFGDFVREAAEAFFDRPHHRQDQRYRHHARYRDSFISVDQAIEIARRNGMVRVVEVEFDDDEWEIEGMTSADAKWRSRSTPAPGA